MYNIYIHEICIIYIYTHDICIIYIYRCCAYAFPVSDGGNQHPFFSAMWRLTCRGDMASRPCPFSSWLEIIKIGWVKLQKNNMLRIQQSCDFYIFYGYNM